MVANKILMAIDFSILTACTRLDLFSRVLQECMSIGTVLDSCGCFFFVFYCFFFLITVKNSVLRAHYLKSREGSTS